MKRLAVGVAAVLVALSCSTLADPLPQLDYQGKVLVNDLPFNGTGYFKFALANTGGTNLWANDGTSVGEPSSYVTLSVVNGVFSVVLGSGPGMTTNIEASIFASGTGLYLRVWFSSALPVFSEMLPAQRLVSSAYALNAHMVDGRHATELIAAATNAVTLSGDVAGPVGNVQIQANAVGSAELAPNSVGTSEISDNSVASIDIADNTIANVVISTTAGILGSKLQAGSLTNAGALQLATGSTGAQAIATGHPYLRAFDRVNTLVAGVPNSLLTVMGLGGVYVSNLPPATLQIGMSSVPGSSAISNLHNVVWVATNGTAAGPGAIDRPYDTPQNGYNAAAARYAGQPCAVLLAAGVYPGGLNMNAGNVHVLGLDRAVLDSVTVSAGAIPALLSKQRVENVVIKNATVVTLAGLGVKFYNCRLLGGLQISGNRVEVQNCYITQTEVAAAAVVVGDGANATDQVGLHHASIEYGQPGGAALLVNQKVTNFELLWSEVVCTGGGPAIQDNENNGPLAPVHLYAHNWIKGPGPDGILPTVADPLAGQNGRTIGFYNNTVWGHVGLNGAFQYYGNNMVYGRINNVGGPVGWRQAGAGTGADAANNTEHETSYPTLPNTYQD